MRVLIPGHEGFLGSILLAWTKASEGYEKESFNFLNKITDRYLNLKAIQKSFLQCRFDSSETQTTFKRLVEDDNYSFKYNFHFISSSKVRR